jgi:hypothetical protein
MVDGYGEGCGGVAKKEMGMEEIFGKLTRELNHAVCASFHVASSFSQYELMYPVSFVVLNWLLRDYILVVHPHSMDQPRYSSLVLAPAPVTGYDGVLIVHCDLRISVSADQWWKESAIARSWGHLRQRLSCLD